MTLLPPTSPYALSFRNPLLYRTAHSHPVHSGFLLPAAFIAYCIIEPITAVICTYFNISISLTQRFIYI